MPLGEANDLISKESHCLNKLGPRILSLSCPEFKNKHEDALGVFVKSVVSKPCLTKALNKLLWWVWVFRHLRNN